MIKIITSFLIALAICIDTFAIGLSYGIKDIKIPKLSLVIINVITVVILYISISLGELVGNLFSNDIASIISFIMLFGLGSFFIVKGYFEDLIKKKEECGDKEITKIRLSRLEIVIAIAVDHTKADMNVSGDIDFKEAIYLGIALSLDSLGVGFGSAIAKINSLQVILFAFILNLIAVTTGLYLGKKIKSCNKNFKTCFISGGILILLGISKLM
ncbi:sporulation membrane protein YtaF [Alkalithermobacter paradoxus]|uniref:sporulation membrane protein YtaF n=1 Tax=Alkalithermobacter paradoxus TaxID=29349 RepID=UPI001301F964